MASGACENVLDGTFTPFVKIRLTPQIRQFPRVQLLVTTRDEKLMIDGFQAKLFKLDVLSEALSEELLLLRSRVSKEVDIEKRKVVLKRCNGHPLALSALGNLVDLHSDSVLNSCR